MVDTVLENTATCVCLLRHLSRSKEKNVSDPHFHTSEVADISHLHLEREYF
jgi:hypothetical protein